MGIYARATTVSVERTKAEFATTIGRYGGMNVIAGCIENDRTAFVAFTFKGFPIRVPMPLPDVTDERFTLTPSGRKKRSADDARAAWEAECRQHWRILLLMVRANLEAVLSGQFKIEDVFLPWLMVKGGGTIRDELRPQLAAAMSGEIRLALPTGKE
jgi:hypothetical protein